MGQAFCDYATLEFCVSKAAWFVQAAAHCCSLLGFKIISLRNSYCYGEKLPRVGVDNQILAS